MSKYILPNNNSQWTPKQVISESSACQQPAVILPFKGKPKNSKELVNDLYQQLEGNKDAFIQLQKDTNSRIWKFKVKPSKKSKPSLLVYVDTKSKNKDAMTTIGEWLKDNMGNTFENILLEVKSIAKKCCMKKCGGCNIGNPKRKL